MFHVDLLDGFMDVFSKGKILVYGGILMFFFLICPEGKGSGGEKNRGSDKNPRKL